MLRDVTDWMRMEPRCEVYRAPGLRPLERSGELARTFPRREGPFSEAGEGRVTTGSTATSRAKRQPG